MRKTKHEQRLDMAIAWAEDARRNALRHVRAAGNPRNPYCAREGREQEFDSGKDNAFGLELALIELKARRREGRADKAVRFADRALDAFIGVGLTALAALGLAAAFILLRLPEPAVQIAAVAGVGVALARTVIAARK